MLSPSPSKFSKTAQKSASLDHEIFLQHHHNNNISSPIANNANDWKHLHPSSALYGANNNILKSHSQCNMTRAISTSSLASSTRTNSHYQEYKAEIINQGKCLCGQYIRARLRRAGVLNRKVIQRLRTILEPSTSSAIVYEVFPAINSMGEELERMFQLYSNVSRQLTREPFGELVDSDTAPMLLNLVAKDLFRSNITWGKIVSIFAVCGGFAIDCVRQQHYDYLQFLIDGIVEIIEDDLACWLVDNGGWVGLQQHISIRPQMRQFSFLGWLTVFVTISSGVYIISNCLKHMCRQMYSLIF